MEIKSSQEACIQIVWLDESSRSELASWLLRSLEKSLKPLFHSSQKPTITIRVSSLKTSLSVVDSAIQPSYNRSQIYTEALGLVFNTKNSFTVCIFRVFIGDKPGFLLVTAKEDRLKMEFRTIKPKQKYRRLLSPRNKLPECCKEKYPKLLENFFKSMQGT